MRTHWSARPQGPSGGPLQAHILWHSCFSYFRACRVSSPTAGLTRAVLRPPSTLPCPAVGGAAVSSVAGQAVCLLLRAWPACAALRTGVSQECPSPPDSGGSHFLSPPSALTDESSGKHLPPPGKTLRLVCKNRRGVFSDKGSDCAHLLLCCVG